MKDESRKRSLYFLLMVEARKRTLQSGDIQNARAISKNLEVHESSDLWLITSRTNESSISVEVPKSSFQFYPTKNAQAYEIEPSVLNGKSAAWVINELYQAAGISPLQLLSRSAKRSSRKKAQMFNPQHLALGGLFGLISLDFLLEMPPNVMLFGKTLPVIIPIALLFKDTEKWLRSIIILVFSIAIFMISFISLDVIETSTALKFLTLLLLVDALHHKLLHISPLIFQGLILMIFLIPVLGVDINFWGKFTLLVISSLILGLASSIMRMQALRKALFLFGLTLYCIGTFVLSMNFNFWPIIALFIVSQSLIFSLFGFRESPTKLYLGMGFLAI